jgi:ribonuclease R
MGHEEDGVAPKNPHSRAAPPAARDRGRLGDRALMRIEKTDEDRRPAYRGRVIKIIDHARTRVLGIFRINCRRSAAGSFPSTRSRPDAN